MSIKVTFEFDEATGQLMGTSLARDEAALPQAANPAAPTQKRGRGRPVKGEEAAPAAPAAPPAAPAPEADPFAPAAPAAPVATLDEARAALTALAKATTQANAVEVMKGVTGQSTLSNALTGEVYGKLVAAAQAAASTDAPAVEADPFAPAAAPAAAAAPAITLEDIRAETLKASKRTSQDTVAKVVMDLGGKAAKPDGGFGPSFSAIPASNYAAVIAALQALPTTK